jgi:hypothetical protein
MLLFFFSLSALAMDPPAPELLDDLDRWESGMDAVLAGPAGCWDFEGEIRQVVTLHQPPDFFSAARTETVTVAGEFNARLDAGHWVAINVRSDVADGEQKLEVPVVPVVGKLPIQPDDDPGAVSVNVSQEAIRVSTVFGSSVSLLHEAVDAWAGRTETALAEWDADADAVMFRREIPVTEKDNRPIRVDVRFPEAGLHPDRIDAVWPRVVKVGRWPVRGTIRDAQMHVRTYVYGEHLLPRAESLSLVAGFLGFTLGYEQTLTFRSAAICQKTP